MWHEKCSLKTQTNVNVNVCGSMIGKIVRNYNGRKKLKKNKVEGKTKNTRTKGRRNKSQ